MFEKIFSKNNQLETEKNNELAKNEAHDLANRARAMMGADPRHSSLRVEKISENKERMKEITKEDYEDAFARIEELKALAEIEIDAEVIKNKVQRIINEGGRALESVFAVLGSMTDPKFLNFYRQEIKERYDKKYESKIDDYKKNEDEKALGDLWGKEEKWAHDKEANK